MRQHTIKHDGLTFGVLSAGDPVKPCLLLLHGWPHSKVAYDGVIDELAADHFVLAFDLPAIGDSRGAPRSSEKKELADLVIGAAERAGATSIVVAGFDVGGMVAHAAARDHAQRIVGAVVMNTVLPGIDPWDALLADPRVWHFAFHNAPALPELLVAGHQRAYFDFFTNMLVGNKAAVSERHRATFAQAYERPEALSAGFEWYRAMAADAERNSQRKDIDIPLLYLRGDADGVAPDAYVRGLKSAGAKHVAAGVLEGSGEIAPLEAPRAFTQALRAFSRDTSRSRDGR
jgi:pimeloyl-ACP methyl ester carboxylesterase